MHFGNFTDMPKYHKNFTAIKSTDLLEILQVLNFKVADA